MPPCLQFSLKDLFRWTLVTCIVLAASGCLPFDNDFGGRVAAFLVLAANFFAVAVFFRSAIVARVKIGAVVAIAALPLVLAIMLAAPRWFVGLISYCLLLAVVPASIAGIWYGHGRWRAFSVGCLLSATLFAVGETMLLRLDGGWYGFRAEFRELGDLELVVVAQLVPPAAGGIMMAVYSLISRCLQICQMTSPQPDESRTAHERRTPHHAHRCGAGHGVVGGRSA